MSKLSHAGVKKMTADLDRVASAIQNHHVALGIPTKIAQDFAWSCDFVSDHLERRAGLRKKEADLDPKENFTESETIPNRFDAAEIGMESDGPVMQDPDEPYMDCFVQDEFDQLREVQQTGMFSNAKVAASAMQKMAEILRQRNIKLPVMKSRRASEEDEETEDEDKKASDLYGLFG